QLQRRCGKTEPTQPAVRGADQITDLPSYQRPGSLRMFPDHQFVPDSHLALLHDQDQLQCADLTHLARHSFRFRYRLGQPPRHRTTLLNFWSGELKPAFGFQFPQALQATPELVLHAGPETQTPRKQHPLTPFAYKTYPPLPIAAGHIRSPRASTARA